MSPPTTNSSVDAQYAKGWRRTRGALQSPLDVQLRWLTAHLTVSLTSPMFHLKAHQGPAGGFDVMARYIECLLEGGTAMAKG